MTEYDYSPAAYDKYLRTQARVSKWVAAQVENSTEYDNPFIPVVATESSRKLAKSSPKSRSSTASASSSTLQQTKPPPRRPVRSGTEPPRPSQRDRQVRSHTIHGSQPGQVQQDRTSVKHRHPKKGSDLDDPHQSSYSHRTRSSRRAGHTRSSSTGETYTVKRDPNGNTIVHLTSKSAGEVINLPPPRANGGYVIVAPPHVKVEVMDRSNHKVKYEREPGKADQRHENKQPTLFRRLFGLTSGSRGSSSLGSRRRSSI